MEKEKLNLCELLRNCEGEEFYSLIDGEVKLRQLTDEIMCRDEVMYLLSCSLDGVILLYPSRELYEKYPLDAYSAWMEWKESRKPKRWHPKNGEGFWGISTTLQPLYYPISDEKFDWKSDLNHFETHELAKQAAEKVKECLIKFHNECLISKEDLAI